MMRIRYRCISSLVIVLAALLISGCVTTEKQAVPELLPMTEQEVPGDVKLAAATVVTRINGYVPTEALGISFKPGDWSSLDNPEYDYAGFTIKTHQLYQYALRPNGKPGRMAAGKFRAKHKNAFWIKLALSPGKEAGGGYRKIIFHEDLRKIAAK